MDDAHARRKDELEAVRHALAESVASEHRAWAMFDNAALGMALLDMDGRYSRVNLAWQRIIGYTEAELLGMSFADLTYPFDLEATVEQARRLSAGEIPHLRIEKRFVHKEGYVVWTRVSVSVVPEASGDPRYFSVQIEDISQAKHALEALRESERKFKAVFDQTFQFMGLLTTDGRVIDINQTALKAAGTTMGAIIGQPFWETPWWNFSPAEQERCKWMVSEAASGAVVREQIHQMSAEQGIMDVDFTMKPVRDEHNNVLWLLPEGRDITKLLRTEQELARRTSELQQARELAALKDHFLSTISHEMKTPLALILGNAELLEDQCPQRELVGGIMNGGQRLAAHLNQILDYSALVSGSLSLYQNEINLPELIGCVADQVQAAAHQQGLRFETEVPAELPPIMGDSRRLSQILYELLDNARKATPQGGRFGLRVVPSNDEICMEVWDTGPGIEPEALSKVWEPFYQVEVGDSDRKGGLGLGLPIAKMLTDLHGGRIDIESTVGEGTRCFLHLPVRHDGQAS